MKVAMTARQQGKSIVGNNPTAVWLDEWDDQIVINDSVKPVNKPIGSDPLALIIKWKEDGTDAGHCHSIDLLRHPAKLSPKLLHLEPCHIEQAETIRQYYLSKFVTTILKGNVLTPYRKKLYDALELKNSICSDSIGALYKAVDFYYEDIAMDKILSEAVSLKISQTSNVKDRYAFVGSVIKRTRGIRQKRYWFKNKNNTLATFFINTPCASIPVVDEYFKKGKTYFIEKEDCSALKLTGTDDFFIAHFLGNKYTITEVK